MYFLPKQQLLSQNIEDEEIAILGTYCYSVAVLFQRQVGQGVPLFYGARFQLVHDFEHICWVPESHDFVVRTAYVDWAQAFAHYFPID